MFGINNNVIYKGGVIDSMYVHSPTTRVGRITDNDITAYLAFTIQIQATAAVRVVVSNNVRVYYCPNTR